MEQETLKFFKNNIKKWRCPRCISCAKCDEYIYEPENLQCLKCGRVICLKCRPKNGFIPIFPYNNWYCNMCLGKATALTPLKNKSPIKKETSKQKSGNFTLYDLKNYINLYRRIVGLIY